MNTQENLMKLEILKMARDLVINEYTDRRAQAHNMWLTESEKVWNARKQKLPYPTIPPHPTEVDVVNRAKALTDFVTADDVEPTVKATPVTTSVTPPRTRVVVGTDEPADWFSGLGVRDIIDAVTVRVDHDYLVTLNNCFIGVNCKKPVKITLPSDAPDGKVYIIKAEMEPPVDDRTVTITTEDSSFIDGEVSVVLKTAFAAIHLIRHMGEWWTIAFYK